MEGKLKGLFITEVGGTPHHLPNASVHWTIKNLKTKIQTVKGLSWDTINVYIAVKLMDDDGKTLFSYGVKDGDTITFALREGIQIMTIDGEKIRIRNARDNWTVGQFRKAVADYIQAPPNDVQLLFRCGVMSDNTSLLSQFKIKPENCIVANPTVGGAIYLSDKK